MSLALPFRCVICTLYYHDSIIHVDRNQAEKHLYHDHDYAEKLKIARFLGLVSEDEKRSAWWLSYHLTELSILGNN